MKRFLLYFCILFTFFLFLTGCDEATTVSQAERVELWIEDFNNANFGSMGQHFYSGMTQYSTLVVLPSYWHSSSDFASATATTPTSTSGFTISTNSSTGSNTRQVVINGSNSSMDMSITFREDSEDVWVMELIEYTGSGTDILY